MPTHSLSESEGAYIHDEELEHIIANVFTLCQL